jgi:SAM-dependent methyltransferase
MPKGLLAEITTSAVWERYLGMLAEQPGVRVLEYMLGRPRILEWVHSVGAAEDRVLRSLAPPVPPDELRSITAEAEIPVFLWTGVVDLQQVMELHARHGRSKSNSLAVLDFGCGCGRLTRLLSLRPDKWSTHGCDVNASHVRWCQDHLPTVRTQKVGSRPPSSYRDAQFDLVYSISVFTHLPSSVANDWLREIHRVLRPGGLFILTTHGTAALDTIARSKVHQAMFQFDETTVGGIREKLGGGGFAFVQYEGGYLACADAGEEYGTSFVLCEYIRNNWAVDGLDLVEHLPGMMRGWQDFVVLRRI